MNRRSFLQTAGTAGIATGLAPTATRAYIPEHNWEKHDWGSGPEVKGVRYPMNWACHQKTNSDGSLTLRRNVRG